MEEQVKQRPSPNEKLVRVFDTEQETEAMVVRGLLESADIDCDVTSLDAQQEILPGVGGTVILVREEDAATARRLIEEYRRVPGDDEAIEAEVSGEGLTDGVTVRPSRLKLERMSASPMPAWRSCRLGRRGRCLATVVKASARTLCISRRR